MSRSIVLSNGELCIALDHRAFPYDIYYPHVGLENHVRAHYTHRVGVWADGRMSWLSDTEWHIDLRCEKDALQSAITARNSALGVELIFADTVCNEKPIFIRHITVRNLFDRTRDIKLYFGHEFEIHNMHGSDTAFFDPFSHSIIHYKGQRVFLMSGMLDGELFQDYATGRAHFHGQEGTYRDADDGELGKNPIEHGPADSVIGLYATYEGEQSRVCDYWLIAARSIREARLLNDYVKKKSPGKLLKSTASSWKAWLGDCERNFRDLSDDHIALYKKSLMYVRAHADRGGGIIASVDADMLQYGLDTYSYVWPRDAAFSALALDRAGDTVIAKRFFDFCKQTITDEGYFMHKYWPDTALGSSWHPWILNGSVQLPIQEDETAEVVYAVHEYWGERKDRKLLADLYEPLVKPAADFMVRYRDPETNLPLPSYDLWERKRGTTTYTSAAVCRALTGAAEMAHSLGKEKDEKRYAKAAAEIKSGIMKYLWNEETGMFHNALSCENGTIWYDATVDISSVYGVFLFGILPYDDPRLRRAFGETVRRLSEGVTIGGVARFENDDYYRVPGPSQGNPWFLTTLWYAEYLVACAQTKGDLERVREIFTWACRHALPSGVLSEQLNPHTGEQVCAGPLSWAHAAYVSAVLKYLDRLEELAQMRVNPI